MYGRVFEQMYEGSMMGAGLHVFAVWNYILTKARKGIVEVNPALVAFKLGGTPEDVSSALTYLQQPDVESRSKLEDGRRLIKEGQFQYRIVNWEHYESIRNEAERREYNRQAVAKHREKKATQAIKTQPTSKFQKPTLEDLINEGLDPETAAKFLNHYDSNGWKVGRNPMKDWRATVRNWKSGNNGFQQHSATSPSGKSRSEIEKGMCGKSYSEMTPEEKAIMDECSS